MKKFFTRAAFVLAIAAVASASFIAPATAGSRLLEVRNKTDYILHFIYEPSGTTARTEVAVMPGGTWGLDRAGMYWFTGTLKMSGAADIVLQRHGILLKDGQRMMILLAVYDNVGSKSFRWYTFMA